MGVVSKGDKMQGITELKNPMGTHVIETFLFTGKLSDVYLSLDYALIAMDEPIVQKKALTKWMEGIPDLVRDERFINKNAFSEKELEVFALRAEENIKASYLKKFNDSKKTVLNMSLVMMCTVVELFFEHVFTVIFKANPQTLLALSKDKNITVEQFLKCATYDEVLTGFIQKSTDKIIREGTKETLKTFDSIGIKTNKLFLWNNFTEEVQLRFADWNEQKLSAIFDERHSIVHDNAMPLKSVEDLLLRKDFFVKIIANISIEAWHKFYKYGVILDAHDQIRIAIKASGGDPNSYPPPPK